MNRRALIEKHVPVLLDDPATGELIVVIDGAHDDTLALLEQWAKDEPRLRPVWQENAGEGSARQRGAELARFDVVVILDDDVDPSADMITRHAMRHRASDVDVVLGYMPTFVPPPRRYGQVASVIYAEDYEGTTRMFDAQPEAIWTHFWAGNFSMKRDRALAVGFVGPVRFQYHEDLFFGLRCREFGLSVAFDRSIASRHSLQRNLRRLALEARRSGEARVVLLHWFPDVSSEINPVFVQTGVRRMVIRALSSSPGRHVVTPVTMALSAVAGRLHLWGVEEYAARVMRQVELVYAFRQRMRRPVEPRGF